MRTTIVAIVHSETRQNQPRYNLDTTLCRPGRIWCMTGRKSYRNRWLERDPEKRADIWDSLFPTLAGARRIRSRNRLVLSAGSLWADDVLVVPRRLGTVVCLFLMVSAELQKVNSFLFRYSLSNIQLFSRVENSFTRGWGRCVVCIELHDDVILMQRPFVCPMAQPNFRGCGHKRQTSEL